MKGGNIVKKTDLLFLISFLLIICTIGIGTVLNKKEVSEIEGRELQKFPSIRALFQDVESFIDDTNTAFSDQMFSRNRFVRYYYNVLYKGLHQNYLDETIIGENGYLFTEPLVINKAERKKKLDQCASYINAEAKKIVDQGSEFVFISYPRKDVALYDLVPSYYPASDQEHEENMKYLKSKLDEEIIVIDGAEVFKQDKDIIPYYQTDHHVNIRGQEQIFLEFMQIVKNDYPDINIHDLSDYEISVTKINGSYNRKIGNLIPKKLEELYLKPKWDYSYVRYEDGDVSEYPLINKVNEYRSYMFGDNAETEILTSNEEYPTYLVCGSSFTNALEYLLIPESSRMVSLDFRHNESGKSLYDYTVDIQPDYVIFIPAQSNDSFSPANYLLHLGIHKEADDYR